jgi:mono/diheme cytochrome c family protein
MITKLEFKAALAGLLTGGLALGAAFGFARLLQHRAAAISHEQPATAFVMPPATLPPNELVAKGRTLFLNSCAHCHGADALGDEGPDLHDLQMSDRHIINVIRKGIKGEMPSFAKKHADPDQVALLAYVRSLH